MCKQMFMATFDIHDRKIRTIAAKKIVGAGVAADDGRLTNASRLTVSEEHKEYIRSHILSFPSYTSHYGRAKSERLYLSSDLSIAKMYQLYQESASTDGLVPVSYSTYQKIFNSLNLSFRKPKLDTCGKCDQLRVKIKMESDTVEQEKLKELLLEHQESAQKIYEQKRIDIKRTRTDSSFRVVSFDLQKQLPTPHLTCGQAFYARQLYTLNLTIFESYLNENRAHCYLWDETKARRGSQEIGSCLLKDLLSVPSTVTEVVYYSDRCAGQNLNKNIVYLFMYIVELFQGRNRPITIYHKFMKTGHSHMEVDSIHAAIERSKKKMSINIETPRDWAVFIASVRRSIPFNVVEMEQTEFKEIKSLANRYTLPTVTNGNEKIKFRDIMIFKYTTEHPGIVEFKYDISECQFQSMNLKLDQDQEVAENITLQSSNSQPIPLSAAKIADLKKLMPFIVQKQYYSVFLQTLNEKRRGRKPKNDVQDHFDHDIYDCLDSDTDESTC